MSAAAGSITARNAIFTTPTRPFDVTALFPQLAPLARTTTRLHPRPGAPTVHDSSVGGPLLWPADEPWPYCDVLDGPHEPPIVQDGWYLPEPCLFSPEQVTDYPHPMELDNELRGRLEDMSRWAAIDPAQYNVCAYDPGELYLTNLCTAPGWKTGGWTRWSPGDPVDRACPECGTEAVPLLTIASSEWDGGSATWIAEEDRPTPGPPPLGARDGDFTLIDIAGGNNLQLHVCPSSPYHPHVELLQ
ncbi:non-ribosomal peptide synthetase [Streptomyces sp. NPDC059985]|uniref:non-ribosomal peptide synthetase n=1 Tax=Streptomyces sp. NPDC059985 TaxID=3347025 RepID=UPI0036C395F8